MGLVTGTGGVNSLRFTEDAGQSLLTLITVGTGLIANLAPTLSDALGNVLPNPVPYLGQIVNAGATNLYAQYKVNNAPVNGILTLSGVTGTTVTSSTMNLARVVDGIL
jgi:hypothetical protein